MRIINLTPDIIRFQVVSEFAKDGWHGAPMVVQRVDERGPGFVHELCYLELLFQRSDGEEFLQIDHTATRELNCQTFMVAYATVTSEPVIREMEERRDGFY